MNTKSTLGVGVGGGGGVAVGGRGVAVTVGGRGDGVLDGKAVWVGDAVAVGGNRVGVGGSGVGVAVSTGVGVLVGAGARVGVGVVVGGAIPQPETTPTRTMPIVNRARRSNAPLRRWRLEIDKITLTRITFPLCSVSVIMPRDSARGTGAGILVPKVGFEPTRGFTSLAFEASASASSATPAHCVPQRGVV